MIEELDEDLMQELRCCMIAKMLDPDKIHQTKKQTVGVLERFSDAVVDLYMASVMVHMKQCG